MIAKALEFLTSQLDDYLIRKHPSNKSIVVLSGLVTASGEIAVTQENALVISVVNIAEEGSIANQPNIRRQGNTIEKQASPVYINLYILITALFKDSQYKSGLSWLSQVITFFQQNPYFNSSQVEMPEGIDKLSLELVNLDIDNMSRFWGALGARYQPSVIYKMRMLKISADSVDAVLPEIKEPNVNVPMP
ncbi:DUF4255 domain-containing protein [Lacinutrix chionoecetis]